MKRFTIVLMTLVLVSCGATTDESTVVDTTTTSLVTPTTISSEPKESTTTTEANISYVFDWNEAAGIAENPNWNSNWWEIEEQLKVSLINESLRYIEEEELSHALNHVTSQTAGQSLEAVAFEKFTKDSEDIDYYQSFVNAAAGMAIASAYQAALVLSASADQDHPFSLKFQLFENGRLPLGIIGNTFSIFSDIFAFSASSLIKPATLFSKLE